MLSLHAITSVPRVVIEAVTYKDREQVNREHVGYVEITDR